MTERTGMTYKTAQLAFRKRSVRWIIPMCAVIIFALWMLIAGNTATNQDQPTQKPSATHRQ